jgi:hypothetical protein
MLRHYGRKNHAGGAGLHNNSRDWDIHTVQGINFPFPGDDIPVQLYGNGVI